MYQSDFLGLGLQIGKDIRICSHELLHTVICHTRFIVYFGQYSRGAGYRRFKLKQGQFAFDLMKQILIKGALRVGILHQFLILLHQLLRFHGNTTHDMKILMLRIRPKLLIAVVFAFFIVEFHNALEEFFDCTRHFLFFLRCTIFRIVPRGTHITEDDFIAFLIKILHGSDRASVIPQFSTSSEILLLVNCCETVPVFYSGFVCRIVQAGNLFQHLGMFLIDLVRLFDHCRIRRVIEVLVGKRKDFLCTCCLRIFFSRSLEVHQSSDAGDGFRA